MRGIFAAVAATLMISMVGQAMAQDNPVVVELYTSQGCSSCPPADEILLKLAQRDDVIALALHVDYWDYIGWSDTFADPQYTTRQRAYARAISSRTIYTPQMIVGGVTHVVGNRPMEVVAAVDEFRGKKSGVVLQLVRTGDRLSVKASLSRGRARNMLVQLVRYIPSSSVSIERGENAGRTIEYVNIVTEWRQIKKWNGAEPLDLVVNVVGSEPVVVIVQAAGQGPIMASARLR